MPGNNPAHEEGTLPGKDAVPGTDSATEDATPAKKHMTEAAEKLISAASDGDIKAMRELGNRYKSGRGVDKDYAQMEQWWTKAADSGDSTAMWDLGYYYLIGKYIPKDPDKAVKWFQRAADAGNADAAFELGFAYEHGQFVEQDFVAAQRWLAVAGKLGNEKAAGEQEAIARKLAATERAQARKAAKAAADAAAAASAGAPVPPDEETAQVQGGKRGSDIAVEHVSQHFGEKKVLEDISLDIKGGELIAIVGSSGGGKSTFVNIIRGELKPSEGTVHFEGTFGFVPQANLVHENLTVAQQLSFYAKSVKKIPAADQARRIDEVVEDLGLAKSKNSIIRNCSGGEKRRVSVACELLARPDSLLLDEPTSGLDPGDSGDLIDVLHDLVVTNDMTIIVINHDYENIQLFDKIIFLAKGRICFYGTPKRLFEYFDTVSPRTIYNLMRANPDPFIRRFDDWRTNNPAVAGGIQ